MLRASKSGYGFLVGSLTFAAKRSAEAQRPSPSMSRRFAGAVLAVASLVGCAGGLQKAVTPPITTGPMLDQFSRGLPGSDPVYRTVVLATTPIAYFPLDSATEGSIVGGYTTAFVGGASIKQGGPIQDEQSDQSASLSGNGQYVTTSLTGGIPGAGSMIAWVNLAALPGTVNRIFYVSGESQFGNDFDLQFLTDNAVHFYTGAGENTSYAPPVSALVGNWHMIAVTYQGGDPGFRYIYWDGALVATGFNKVDSSPKTSEFSMGESLFFTGRYFQGEIDDVAVWNRALSSREVARIYRAAH